MSGYDEPFDALPDDLADSDVFDDEVWADFRDTVERENRERLTRHGNGELGVWRAVFDIASGDVS